MKITNLLLFLGASAVLFLAHYFLMPYLPVQYADENYWKYHVFMVIYIVVSLLVLEKVKSVNSAKLGLTFLATSSIKMFAGTVFLLVLYSKHKGDKLPIYAHFFGTFFLYLFAEVLIVLKMLRSISR